MKRVLSVLVAALSFSVVLAGCTDDVPVDDPQGAFVDPDGFDLQQGKGAISGFLVDDRFRPIAGATILNQEVGQRATTTANGEFQFIDLDPGVYTLRVTAEGHEAAPTKIRVEEGYFADAQLLARRVVSEGGTIITQEYAIFIDCWIPVWTELNCFLDMSLDSKRAGFTSDYTSVSNITYVKSEWLFEDPGKYQPGVGKCTGESYSGWHDFVMDGTYASLILTTDKGEWDNRTEDTFLGGYLRELKFCTVVFPQGQGAATGLPFSDWVGFGISTQANIVQSVFIGVPEVDIVEYCTLCES